MSRTLRRNKKHLINSHCGTREECLEDPWWVLYRFPNLPPEVAYERHKARYTRDHRSGRYGVPNWYRREHGVFRVRRRERHLIFCHMRTGCWDGHLPENRMRDSMYYWW